ncbi:zinc finger and BTB domain-containing protein 41-like [Dreissena polymorpha]|uniref:zinc finger and BTB domain-containing protein 41-like n=1 Tax=Dreissena polymorpha TaxID=45954 RepID=UPI002263FFA0|nr:zinc finger and BTB domain-containing protein 41-like [Dreissena polymorpha]XP_052218548.1 zinc finger and BTB domain-containing protein 41-like [Dreissena polymorpha]
MTTRSTDSQEPGQTTSVHTGEVDETSTETKEHSDTAHEYNSQDAAENMLNSESSDIDDSDNDKDYIPEEGDAASDESIVVELIPNIQRFQKKTASTLPPVESLQSRERDESSAKAHKTNITIAQTNNSEYRHYDKRFYCMFCEKAQIKLKKTFAFAA